MADSKKYNGSTWEHSLRKLTTATEAVENPLYSDGTAITAYTIKGNTVQDGTPTPSNPVNVQGVGVRTDNLFITEEVIWVDDAVRDIDGNEISSSAAHYTSSYTRVSPSTTYTLGGTLFVSDAYVRIYFYDSSKTWISRSIGYERNDAVAVFTTPANCEYIQIQAGKYVTGSDFMLVSGEYTAQTIPAYEPYGYKIPISNGQQTTNVYLGSTQTVRQIKKVVLTGEESGWAMSGTGLFYNLTLPDNPKEMFAVVSTHFTATTNPSGVEIGCIRFGGTAQSPTQPLVFNYDNGAIGLTAFKQWLAAQYSAGTPVTVWYVLANPETATVNEPLMKIGTYADTLSNAAQIPTTEGANSITVDTTVQPSEFTATWTGWHDAEVKEWDGNDWQ